MRRRIKARKAKQAKSINKIIQHLSELVQHDENFILKIGSEVGDVFRILKDLRERVEALEKIVELENNIVKKTRKSKKRKG